jgi:hypothetical protein
MGIIPTDPHEPKTSMSDYLWLVYGQPKIGKSTFCNQWPGALFAATEPGTSAMRAADVPINSWTDFENFMHALGKEKSAAKYKTIVVDTIDNLWSFLCNHICKTQGWEHISEGGYAKGYNIAEMKLTNAIAELRSFGKAVVFVSHERKTRELDNDGNTTGSVFITSNLPNSARKVIHGNVDFIFRAEHHPDDSTKRVVRTSPRREDKEIVECGSRGSEYRNGKPTKAPLPELIDMSFPSLHQAFKQSFTNGE